MTRGPKRTRAIVIFGATGDLALRMLYPSLYLLDVDRLLPDDVAIVGSSRSQLAEPEFAARVEAAVRERAGDAFSEEIWAEFRGRLSYLGGDASQAELYTRLSAKLESFDETIFYLSTSPSLYEAIASNLELVGLASSDRSRIVVEKPIGRDLKSCREINDILGKGFSEDRIFRVDHYLGKEAVQNLLALRFANTFFEPLWNRVSIDHVQITVAETVGVEGRWGYYDEYGAVRDMVQNHMLQLLCLVAMEPPANLDPDSVRNEKVKVLRSLRPINGREVERKTVRGQYRAGVADGRSAPGYLEDGGGKASDTETFVALCANVDNWRWAGVPFYLRTGKRMPERSSQIVIQFREAPHSIFKGSELLANRLTIRLQPEEEISLGLMNKTPALEQDRRMDLKPLALNLSLSDAFPSRRRIAYERLLLEALKNDPTLFVRRDEAEAAWAWIDAIVAGWAQIGMKPTPYVAGTWGPQGAQALVERDGRSWYE